MRWLLGLFLLLQWISVAQASNDPTDVIAVSHPFETLEDKEEVNASRIVRMMGQKMKQSMSAELAGARFFHAKGHGCVIADLTILPVETDYRVGVFDRTGETFKSIVRFSDGNKDATDSEKNIRGAAIKLLLPPENFDFAVPQNQLLNSQDFLLVTGEAMFVDSVQTIHDLFLHLGAGKKAPSFFLKRAFSGGLRLMVNASRAKVRISSPFQTTYHSASAYALGDDMAVRYDLTRQSCRDSSTTKQLKSKSSKSKQAADPAFLAKQLVDDLSASEQEPICMTLGMQVQTDKKSANVERPHYKWKGAKHVDVAEIRFTENLDTGIVEEHECKPLSFRPWHSLVEHRPLGGLNRLRKKAYHDLFNLRRSPPKMCR
jgi:hypothetical protein